MARASNPVKSGRQRQRGAAAVMGAVTAILGLIAVGLTVDLARLYAAQRSLQRIANVAALDASRLAGGCFGAAARGPSPLATAIDEARASLIRNGGDPSWIDGGGQVRLGIMRVDDAGVRQFDPLFDDEGVPLGAITAHDSVQVVLLRPTPPRLIPGFSSDDDREMVAVASARSRPVASFGVGSGLLGVDLSQSLLDPVLAGVLGGSPSVSVLNYRNLLGVGVSVGDLTEALEQGELGELLVDVVPATDLLNAVADLVELATADLGGGVSGLNELLGLTPDIVGAAGDLIISVGQLTSQAVRQLAVGAPINIDCPAALSILGLDCSGGSIQVLDPGTPGAQGVPYGSDSDEGIASSGQVAVGLPGIAIDTLGGAVTGNVSVMLNAATGEARVRDIQCPRAGSPHPEVRLDVETGLAGGEINLDLLVSLDVQRTRDSLESLLGPLDSLLGGLLGGLLGSSLLDIGVVAGVSVDAPIRVGSGGDSTLVFQLDELHDPLTGEPSQRHPSSAALDLIPAINDALSSADISLETVSVTVAGRTLSATQATTLANELLGAGGPLLAEVTGLLDGLTEPITVTVDGETQTVSLASVINQLLDQLGVQVAYADYRVFNVTDAQPVLFQR